MRFGHALSSYGVKSKLKVFSFVFFWTDGCLVHHKSLDLYLISYGESVDFVGFVTRPRRMGGTALGLDIRVFPSRSKDDFFFKSKDFVFFCHFCRFLLIQIAV